ncbi:biotin--[acetyl-CoA-carboxylase] ligase [Niabella yanshanensis]|uniref:Biotin--[acetyl-CoA-carboxylase] ligase n=1 Tax=Niabella yanshanensis TaxID=577386 RepID=A0ABZ0WDE1_9BACT|nr:biotin--[acetyl-CoA-carboxylase] ligase [Niabella yanshanensis]WQD40714.1 biotin--[acetyl-CoA-carboxylase] ligase [Niabella yanshanensis]
MAQQSADNCPFPPVIELLSIDSTNNYALSRLKQANLTERQETLQHGSAVFAHEQYAGKGQRGKTWQSKRGENVHLSVVLNPGKIGLHQQFLLISVVALAVKTVFEHYARSDIRIKWPNDIYFGNRKACGILIENIISGREWKWAVAGIGMNINQVHFPEVTDRQPVSLRQITGKSFDCLEIACKVRDEVLQVYNHTDPDQLVTEYNRFLYKKDESVVFERDGATFEGVVKEVSYDGKLHVYTETMPLSFDFGELQWLR